MDTLVGLARLNEADTVQQAQRALTKVSWTENTTVADDQGNIGFFAGGRLPNKPKRWDERLPFPGTGKAEWRGVLKVRQRPHVINPSQGWLTNWNNMNRPPLQVPRAVWPSDRIPVESRMFLS